MKYLSLFILFISITACTESELYTLIPGEWVCTSWINASGADQCNNNVTFTFKEDRTYSSSIGGVEAIGTYVINDDVLRVQPDGKMELAVQITKLTETEMDFLMNQAGNEEQLKLVKQQ